MLKLADFSAVIFDMDGLVLDTEITYFKAWQQAAAAMGYELSDAFCRTLSGLHYKHLEQRLLTVVGADFDLARFNELSGQFWRSFVQQNGIQTRYGFGDFFEQVRQQALPYALATNSRAVNTYECLSLAGLDEVFQIIVTRDDVEHGKPDPGIFLQTATWLDTDIKRCLILEDSLSGVQAAYAAGAFSVYIPSAPAADPQALALCDLQVDDLLQLSKLVCMNSPQSD